MPGGIETKYPGVYTPEAYTAPRIRGVGVSDGAFVVYTRKGPINRSLPVTSYEEFVRRYGGEYAGSVGPGSVRAFFNTTGDSAGARVWISRVLGLGHATSTITAQDLDGLDTVKVDALTPGSHGDDLTVDFLNWKTVTTAALTAGDTSIALASLRGIQKGDRVTILDPGGTVFAKVFVHAITVATRTIQFQPVTLVGGAGPIALGASVECASTHNGSTKLLADVLATDTECEVLDPYGFEKGSRVTFDDGTDFAEVVLTGVSGRKLKFAAIGTAISAATSVVVTQEFSIVVRDGGNVLEGELHLGLSMEPTNRQYVQKRLSGSENQSKEIEVTDLGSTPVLLTDRLPDALQGVSLEGGDDGAVPTFADWIGSDVEPKSGIYVYDEVDEVTMISTPGQTGTVVVGHGMDYCDTRQDCVYIASVPLSDDEVEEASAYRRLELNRNTSYGAIYAPHLIVPDPSARQSLIKMPPDGWVQGEWARVALTEGIHVAPANAPGGDLKGVEDLTFHYNNGHQAILNPLGVNLIRSFPGEGIKIWGCRTLLNRGLEKRRYVPVRRVFNFVKESVAKSTRWAVHRPNDPKLWRQLERTISDFLGGMWQKGQLFPSDDITQAFFVRCDHTTNSRQTIAEGQVWCEVGINPMVPAEFVIIRFGVWDGGFTIEENIQNRF